MKIVESVQFERGDHVLVTHGYNKGMVGKVLKHTLDYDEDSVEVALANATQAASRGDYYDDEDDVSGYYNSKQLKYITKNEYEDGLKANKITHIQGLSVPVQVKGNKVLLGDNVLTEANAKKLIDFINKNLKKKKAKKA